MNYFSVSTAKLPPSESDKPLESMQPLVLKVSVLGRNKRSPVVEHKLAMVRQASVEVKTESYHTENKMSVVSQIGKLTPDGKNS